MYNTMVFPIVTNAGCANDGGNIEILECFMFSEKLKSICFVSFTRCKHIFHIHSHSFKCHDWSLLFIEVELGFTFLKWFAGELWEQNASRKAVCRWQSVNERKRKCQIYTTFRKRKGCDNNNKNWQTNICREKRMEANRTKQKPTTTLNGKKKKIETMCAVRGSWFLRFSILNKHIHAWIQTSAFCPWISSAESAPKQAKEIKKKKKLEQMLYIFVYSPASTFNIPFRCHFI